MSSFEVLPAQLRLVAPVKDEPGVAQINGQDNLRVWRRFAYSTRVVLEIPKHPHFLEAEVLDAKVLAAAIIP